MMPIDRSDEIRLIVLRQRIERFTNYLEKKRDKADFNANGRGYISSWNNAYALGLDQVHRRSQKIFRGKEDKPVTLED